MSRKDEILNSFKPVVKCLGKTLGRHYEVALHDVSRPEQSIIAIENGHVTDRKIGSPATDLLLNIINSEDARKQNMELNYVSTTKNGKRLKSSTTLIRDDENKVIGALCINIDLTHIEVAKNFLNEISVVEQEEEHKEKFPEDVNEFLETMIQNSLDLINKPVSLLTKEDKLEIVKYLNKNNIFDIKGGVTTVANELNVSKYTIYNYLDEIRVK